jgi:hypothetical protein
VWTWLCFICPLFFSPVINPIFYQASHFILLSLPSSPAEELLLNLTPQLSGQCGLLCGNVIVTKEPSNKYSLNYLRFWSSHSAARHCLLLIMCLFCDP